MENANFRLLIIQNENNILRCALFKGRLLSITNFLQEKSFEK